MAAYQRAVTCTTLYSLSLRIKSSIVVFNDNYQWWVGTSNNSGGGYYLDFLGEATHEFGHAGGLIDLSDDPGTDNPPVCQWTTSVWSMCQGGAVSWTYYKRNLTTHDIDSANATY